MDGDVSKNAKWSLAGGKCKSNVSPTKKAAKNWTVRTESKATQSDAVAVAIPFRDILDRSAREVSPGKRGHRWKVIRFEKTGKNQNCSARLGDLRPSDFTNWHDRRLREVSPASVPHKMALLSGVLSITRKEWGLLSVNPMQDVRKPPSALARYRSSAPSELEMLAETAGGNLSLASARVFHAFRFAIETGMRAGEIVGLRAGDVDTRRRGAILPKR